MAHNLRNALMPALLRIDVLATGTLSPPDLRTELSRVRASLSALQSLATGLCLVAGDSHNAVERSTTRLAMWWHDVEPLVHAAIVAGTGIRADMAGTLPPALVPPSLLAQVVMALVLNANHWMLGTPSPQIQLTARQHDDAVCLTVRHTGDMPSHGIPYNTADPLRFESPIEFASGMRLTQLREQLREHEGDLTMDDFSPTGGAFSVWLRAQRETRRSNSSTVRVQLALSDPRHSAVARMVLSQHGLTEWTIGVHGVLPANAPHVVICDVLTLPTFDRMAPARAAADIPRLIVIGAAPRQATRSDITWISPGALGMLSIALRAEDADHRAN